MDIPSGSYSMIVEIMFLFIYIQHMMRGPFSIDLF